jgi:hypothetical protein
MSAKEKQAQSEQPKTISLKVCQYDEIYECAAALAELSYLCKKGLAGRRIPWPHFRNHLRPVVRCA